ncbi:hypothetical protein HRbin30_02813 [bacterium HR30]|nr:hypothetical protein HRbin30_02813 [bacterium HR30]
MTARERWVAPVDGTLSVAWRRASRICLPVWTAAATLLFAAVSLSTQLGTFSERAAVKWTYVGPQSEPVPSLVFTEGSWAEDIVDVFHSFESEAVDRGNDDVRDPEGNRTVPVVPVSSVEMQVITAVMGEVSADASLPVAGRLHVAVTILWDEAGFVRAEELIFEPARAWRMFRLFEEAEALGERGSLRLRDLAGMVCGVNDGDGDGVPNLCDTCPTVPGTDASGGVRTAPGIAISMVERRWRRSFGESGSCLGSSPQTSARRWIVTAMLV